MQVGHRTVGALVARMEDHGADWCDSYGEPGYGRDGLAGVILGYYWCKCDAVQEVFRDGRWTRLQDGDAAADGEEVRNDLHGLELHYPRVFAALEEQGWQLEWSDEWIVDYDGASKCYRTQPNGYGWQSSILWTDGDFLTPDQGIDAWIEEVANDPHRCLPSHVWSHGDLTAAGFEQWEPEEPHTYESGWHPGQTDDPEEITRQIRETVGDDRRIVFLLDSTGQFDVRFSAWVETDTDD